ncbi:MAG: class I SAM-dependent methyltransferase [Actinomycetota bacterium]|nr:class I SAM-dependent methyltransferase [Actinomycetota bacterium]
MSVRRKGPEDRDVWDELSFLAPPGQTSDWRMVLLFDAAAEAGLLSALPGRTQELAAQLGLDAKAVRVVLEALAVWGLVQEVDGRFTSGPALPDDDEAAVLRHHARSLRLWSAEIDDRLRGVAPSRRDRSQRRLELWLDALAVNARHSAPAAVDACLARLPEARRMLDLGGGHGEYALEFARRGLQTTMQDRPEVIDLASRRGRLAAAGIELFAGDFFEVLPKGPFDIVFCAGVTYTYSADRNLELFRRVRPLLGASGMLALHTFLRGRAPVSALFAVQMLGATGGGDTHAEDDYRQWLSEAGYSNVEVVDLSRQPESLLFATT